ncbi:hypothetical protein JOD64_000752 [Micromonospora luteifusca]|uniref:Uncharacterized protein n=1 Tax=Micromonospora luteifusca TaxID=709860 RepID=A0ABS2LMX1_9ACTN|nr:hypothetical protein [Micromonospora luteifusca]
MTGLLLRPPAENHRALRTHDLTGLHPADRDPGQHIAADVPERH